MPLAETAKLIVALTLDDKFSGPLRNANSQLGKAQAGFSQIGRGAGQVGAGVGRIAERVALLGAAAGTFTLLTAASFEQAEAGIRKTVAGTTDEVDDLIASIKTMATEVPVSFEELAGIAAEGGALGIATDSLANFTDIIARLSVSTDLTAESASAALGQLANVLHLSDQELRDFSDSLVALGNDGASTESQILDMTARFGVAGKQAGLSNEAILALASTTASMGIEAEAGGGALSRIFNGITVDIANASDESEALADAMGLSLAELRTAWDQDAGAVFGDLLGILKDMDKFETAQFLGNLGITNTRDIAALTALAEGAEEYGDQLATATGQTDELNEESDAFFNTTEGKWKIFQNQVKGVADTVGSELLPIVNDLLEEFGRFLNTPETQQGIKDFAKDLAQGVRDFVKEMKEGGFDNLVDTLKGVAGIAKTAFDAFNALPGPVKSLALAALIANKVSGGAVGQIAGGLASIFGAALKTIFAANVTVIGKSVTGGGPGIGPTPGGSGPLALLGTAGVAALVLAGITELFTEIDRSTDPTGHQFLELAANRGASRVVVEGDLVRLSQETGQSVEDLESAAIPLLESGDQSWADTVTMLEEVIANQKNPPKPPATATEGESSGGVTWTEVHKQGEHVKTKLDVLTKGVDELPDTALVTPGITALTKLPPILDRTGADAKAKADAQLRAAGLASGYLSRTASASEITSRKKTTFSLTATTNVNTTVQVSTTILAQQIYQQQITQHSGTQDPQITVT